MVAKWFPAFNNTVSATHPYLGDLMSPLTKEIAFVQFDRTRRTVKEQHQHSVFWMKTSFFIPGRHKGSSSLHQGSQVRDKSGNGRRVSNGYSSAFVGLISREFCFRFGLLVFWNLSQQRLQQSNSRKRSSLSDETTLSPILLNCELRKNNGKSGLKGIR